MTKVQVAEIVGLLIRAFPNFAGSTDTSKVYERMLEDLDHQVALTAVKRVLSTARFMPTIAEIRAAAAEVLHGPKPGGVQAWGAVVEAIQRVGSYRPAPIFRDVLIGECVRALGWKNLCLGDNDAADRARFIQMYDDLAAKRRTETIVAHALVPPAALPELPVFELKKLPRLAAAPRPISESELKPHPNVTVRVQSYTESFKPRKFEITGPTVTAEELDALMAERDTRGPAGWASEHLGVPYSDEEIATREKRSR